MDTRLRRPVSARHAFALAFDLAVRRDALHSIIAPLLLRAPWILALALLPPTDVEAEGNTLLIRSAALLGDFVVAQMLNGMLRLRARSAYNTPAGTRPGPALEFYAQGLKRMPWLVLTEIVRGLAIGFGMLFFFVPGIWLSYRLAFATEAVVLDEPSLTPAFGRSFRVTDRRFERWFEMVVLSIVIVLATLFVGAAVSLIFGGLSVTTWTAVPYLLMAALWPIIQYAWTFFYLRLVELDAPGIEGEVGPMYAGPVPGPGTRPPAIAPTSPEPAWPHASGASPPMGHSDQGNMPEPPAAV